MLLPFPIKPASLLTYALSSLDFYRFRHRHEMAQAPGKKTQIQRPLWIVGNSPFDTVLSEEEGYIVHLGAPRFTARWSMRDETIAQVNEPDYVDEDLNMIIYEACYLDAAPSDLSMTEWFLEAVCAVAYTKGMISTLAGEETH